MKAAAPHAYKVITIGLDFFIRNKPSTCIAVNTLLVAMSHRKVKSKLAHTGLRTAGRAAGGQFTKYASTGGRAGKKLRPKSRKNKVLLNLSYLGTVSLGAMIRKITASPSQTPSPLDIVFSMFTGSNESLATREEFNKLVAAIKSCNVATQASDERLYQNLFSEIENYVLSVEMNTPRIP